MDNPEDEKYNIGPPFSLNCNLAHLRAKLTMGTWSDKETAWLDENVPLFDTGVYDFDPNEWYLFACELSLRRIRTDVWHACCTHIGFKYPTPFLILAKSSDPGNVRDLMTSWLYAHSNMKILPKWNDSTQHLHALSNPTRTKPEHIYALLHAFATPALAAAVNRGLAVNQSLGVNDYTPQLKDSEDAWRFVSWLLSPTVLGTSTPIEQFSIPALDAS